jgi:hypothetical protein
MKTDHTASLSAAASLLVGGMLLAAAYTSAGQQTPDSVVAIVADALGLPFVPTDERPPFGTYFDIRSFLPCVSGPLPFPPLDPNLPVFAVSDHQFLVDQTAGQVLFPLPPEYGGVLSAADAAAILQAQAAELQDFVARIQASQLSAQSSLSRGMAMLEEDDPPVEEGYIFGTNDLWLQIVSGPVTNRTANLIVHPPWNDTDLTHDLYYTESLASSILWQFMMRCAYTNVVVTDLCAAQGFFRLGPATNGDLTLSTDATAQELAQQLVPPWVTVTNVSYTGATEARGTFAGGNGCGLPLESGVILATGYIADAVGPNNESDVSTIFFVMDYNGDTDLDSLTGGGPTYDAAVLEFDIISTNAFTLGFQYIFASEEYPEWIGSYNDPMAIFVSTNRDGTNWLNSITNDLALVPGTTNLAVSVNNINGGCVSDFVGSYDSPTNPQYYVDNADPNAFSVPPYQVAAPAFNVQYDGMTVLLSAQAQIVAGITNHVKIAVADYGDYRYDSAVFIKAWTPCP